MKKQLYTIPAIKVMQMNDVVILSGSGTSGTIDDFGDGGELGEEEEEKVYLINYRYGGDLGTSINGGLD